MKCCWQKIKQPLNTFSLEHFCLDRKTIFHNFLLELHINPDKLLNLRRLYQICFFFEFLAPKQSPMKAHKSIVQFRKSAHLWLWHQLTKSNKKYLSSKICCFFWLVHLINLIFGCMKLIALVWAGNRFPISRVFLLHQIWTVKYYVK